MADFEDIFWANFAKNQSLCNNLTSILNVFVTDNHSLFQQQYMHHREMNQRQSFLCHD